MSDSKFKIFDTDEFNKVVQINNQFPDEGMVDNASLLAFYGTQQAYWEGQVSRLKLQISVQEAVVTDDLRKEAEKLTVAQTNAKIALDPEVQTLNKRLVVAKEQDSLYTMAGKALADRGNNLRSLGTWLRSERGNIGNYDIHAEPKSHSYSREDRAELAKRLANKA